MIREIEYVSLFFMTQVTKNGKNKNFFKSQG